MTLLGHVLQYHQRGFNVLPIAAGTKKPTCEYKHWLSTRQTEQDIRKLFVGDVGVGVILGAVSGNLYVRDFDKLSAYDQWSTTHPQLANTQPTVATMRPGMHVYCTSANRLKTQEFDDGELRGNGSYVVAPPSRHPDGGCYSWRIPLGDGIPTVDPVKAGMIGKPKPKKKSASGCTECTEAVSLSALFSLSSLSSLYNEKLEVEQIAGMALPTSPHDNNRLLFHLARICHTISHQRCKELSQSELQAVFNQWHRLVAKHLRTDQTRDEYLFEFLEGLKHVKYDIGNEPIVQAWERANKTPVPAVAMQFENPQIRLLVGLCRELQRAAGDEPFYLAGRTVAWLLKHKEHTTAANWLRGLVATDILKIIIQGGPATNKATRFRYLPAIEAG